MKKVVLEIVVLLIIVAAGFVHAQSCGVASARNASKDLIIGKCINGQDLNCSYHHQ